MNEVNRLAGVVQLIGVNPIIRHPWITIGKRLRLADKLGSPALRGDAACSLVCLYMAGATLVGLALNELFGLWWADPLAGLALVWWIRGEAAEAVEAGSAHG